MSRLTLPLSPTKTLPILLALGLFAACDTSAKIYNVSSKFDQMQFTSAWPATKNQDGTWSRMCGPGTADGIIYDALFQSSGDSSARNCGNNCDLSIRPGDILQGLRIDSGEPADINLSRKENYQLQISKLSYQRDNYQTSVSASAELGEARYIPYAEDRTTKHQVLVLIDQSGSMGGLVHSPPEPAQGQADEFADSRNKEVQLPDLPSNLKTPASDFDNRRGSAVRAFIETLNDRDEIGVLTFNENTGVRVACNLADGSGSPSLSDCFGKPNKSIWDQGLENLSGSTGGRSNLWAAVDTAYKFLRGEAVRAGNANSTQHIVVITDGPDTCKGESLTSCEAECVTGNYNNILSQVAQDQNDPNGPKVAVHFIQFDAPGYLQQDARQLELACTSGGLYQFIPQTQLPASTQDGTFRELLERAVINVRHSLLGHWQYAMETPAYKNNAEGVGAVPGYYYALEGSLIIRGSAHLDSKDQDRTFPLGFAQSFTDIPAALDRKFRVRKPCENDAQCGGSAANACQAFCSPESLTCVNSGPSAPANLPNLSTCSADGQTGFCCEGSCETTGSCAVCQ